MSEPAEITALEVLELLARGQRRLWEFANQQMQISREDGAAAVTQMLKQAEAFNETLRVLSADYGIESEDNDRLFDYAGGQVDTLHPEK